MDATQQAGTEPPSRTLMAREGKYLTFILGRESYGLEILKVREIIGGRGMAITPLPQVPDEVKGVLNLRGKVIPIIDLRLRFRMQGREYDRETCIIVIHIGALLIGIAVDTVSEVITITEEKIDPPPVMGNSIETDFLLGMGRAGDRVVLLLNIENVLKVEGMDISATGGVATTFEREAVNV